MENRTEIFKKLSEYFRTIGDVKPHEQINLEVLCLLVCRRRNLKMPRTRDTKWQMLETFAKKLWQADDTITQAKKAAPYRNIERRGRRPIMTLSPHPNAKGKADADIFYRSREWRELRYEAFKRYGRHCCVCGRGREHGVVLHVDHKIPRSKRPDLALDISNVQIMCEDDNIGKGNRDSIDWQAPEPDNNPELTAAFKATMH